MGMLSVRDMRYHITQLLREITLDSIMGHRYMEYTPATPEIDLTQIMCSLQHMGFSVVDKKDYLEISW